MATPRNIFHIFIYYLSPTILARSLKRQGLIATVKSGIWVGFNSQLDSLIHFINRHLPIYAELPDNKLTILEKAYYFPRSGMLYVPKMGFVDPILNKNDTVSRFLLKTNFIRLLMTLFRKNLRKFTHVYIGNQVHGAVYGHFVQHILTSHIAILSETDSSWTMLTHPSQEQFIKSYNNSVNDAQINYQAIRQEICKVQDIAIFPVRSVEDQKRKLDTISWSESYTSIPERAGTIILRRGAFERRILNINQVIDTLTRFNIEPLIPEQYQMNQNISVLKKSDVIIAPEGSGLIDCFFLDGPKVLMFTGLVHDRVFEQVIEISSGSYSLIETPQRHTDFIVDLQILEQKLRDLGFQPSENTQTD